MLGTVFDAQLTWLPHVRSVSHKALLALNAVAVILGARNGLRPELARQLVEALVFSRLLWMAGCGLMPVTHRLNLALLKLALRALSAAPAHPLHHPTSLALARPRPPHPATLHRALASPLLPSHVEIAIAASKEEAVELHERERAAEEAGDVALYTDGLLMDGWSGTGVVLRVKGEREGEDLQATRRRAMGQHHGIYQAELEAICIACQSIPAILPPSSTSTVRLFANNQSAISSPSTRAPPPANISASPSASRFKSTLPRRQASLLIRLRTDFSALAASRHRARQHPSGLCKCGERETREHYLSACPLHAAARSTLLRKLRLRSPPPLAALLSTAAFTRPLLRFINATDRFPRYYAAVVEEDERKEKQDGE
ncbi:hypothetical protein JCM10213_001329 [Rhodosporidiobolus nylandii]